MRCSSPDPGTYRDDHGGVDLRKYHQSDPQDAGSQRKNVEEGNLNFEIKPEKDDELGELMQAFEKMRIRLRDNAEGES